MTDIVNLNQFRKKKARAEKAARAENNRITFGRTKAEKQAAKAEQDKQAKTLDKKRLEGNTPEALENPEKD